MPEALYEGFEWDLEGRKYETMEELQAYCARVAASVGCMMSLTMGRREPEVCRHAYILSWLYSAFQALYSIAWLIDLVPGLGTGL